MGVEVKDEKLWGFTKKSRFYGELHEKPMYRGNYLKRGLGQFVDLRGGVGASLVFLKWAGCLNAHYET